MIWSWLSWRCSIVGVPPNRTFSQTVPTEWDNPDYFQTKSTNLFSSRKTNRRPCLGTIDHRAINHTSLPAFCTSGIINRQNPMQVKIAILLTRTMDTIRVRVPFPTFSWGESPQWRSFDHMACGKALSYALAQTTLETNSSITAPGE